MTSPLHKRAKELFLALLEEPPARRAQALEQGCAGDAELRARVERLLAAHARLDEQAVGWLADPGAALRGALQAAPEEGAELGDYALLREIAAGASGRVYRARQRSLGREVALKVLRMGRLASEADVRRFRAEAEAAARLDHPHIVPVYEVGEHAGRHFFSMKLVAGASLAQRRERYRGERRAAVQLISTVARAVHHAHMHGVLHRDLKPSNILLDEADVPHVVDFGIARRLGDTGDATETATISGTPAYMAPEQAEARGEVTVASDVYSLGCVLYELLTGHVPFEADSVVEVLRKAREEAPPPMRLGRERAARDLETIVGVALARAPARRYGSALELAEELERWLEHRPILARRPTWGERLGMLRRREPVAFALGVSVAALVVLLAVGASVSSVVLGAHLTRAREAERDANERLRQALLEQARSLRRTPRLGRRQESLDLLAHAARIRPGADLRDEAILCMGLTDLRLLRPLGPVLTLAGTSGYDPWLERVALALPGGDLELVRVGDGAREALLTGAGVPLWEPVFSHDGRYLAARSQPPVASGQPRLHVWDLARRERVPGLADALSGGRLLDLERAGRFVAVAEAGPGLRVHALPGGERLATLATLEATEALAFDPAGARIAVAGGDPARVELLELPSGKAAFPPVTLPAGVSRLAWSLDGALLAAAGNDCRTYLLDARDGSLRSALVGHQAEVVEVHFGDGLLATYSWDETTRVWELPGGKELLRIPGRVRRFSADGRRIVLALGSGAGIFEVERGSVLAELHGHRAKGPMCLDVDPSGRWLATGATDGTLVWDLRERRLAAQLDSGGVRAVAFHPYAATLLTSGKRGLLRFRTDALEARPQVLFDAPCEHAAASADGSAFAVVHEEHVLVFDSRAGNGPYRLEGFRGIDALAFHPAGRLLAAGSWRGDGVRVWDLQTRALARHLLPGVEDVRMGFSPDGSRLVAGTRDEHRTWSVGAWEEGLRVPRNVPWGSLPGLSCFSRDGRLLALTATQWQIDLVDVASGATLARLEAADAAPVTAMTFLPGGRVLAVATSAQRVLLWDLEALDRELAALGLAASLAPRAR